MTRYTSDCPITNPGRARVGDHVVRVSLRKMLPSLALAGAFLESGHSFAQRASDNAVAAADDAFGTSIGFQNVGLYSPGDARGFSPRQAGNLRVEGLYYDQQVGVTSPCVARETTMQIGLSAQHYSFPAPTGIADIKLRIPGDLELFSAVLTRGPFQLGAAELEAQLPIVERTLSANFCVGLYKGFDIDTARRSTASSAGVTFRWTPASGTQVVPFVAYRFGVDLDVLPSVFTDRADALPVFHEQQLGAPDWTTWGWHDTTVGVVVDSQFGDGWRLKAGLFHSEERHPANFIPYLLLRSAHTADYALDVSPPNTATSVSGEFRLSRTFQGTNHRGDFLVTVRGRSVDQAFGGDSNTDFGVVTFGPLPAIAEPPIAFSAASPDNVRQLDIGVSFEERWRHVGAVTLGALKSRYSRTTDTAPGLAQATRAAPWLPNVRFTIEALSTLTFFGSYVQGLEDSARAPLISANRGESPAATRTSQTDGGVRFDPGRHLQWAFGIFDIHKPYLAVDSSGLYRPVGRLDHRGMETSLSVRGAGLTALAGAVLLRPRVRSLLPEYGSADAVPLGPVPLTMTANADYAPLSWGPWAVSVAWNRLSSRTATFDGRGSLPPVATVGAGLRYQRKNRTCTWVVRLDGYNVTNAQAIYVGNSGYLTPDDGREFQLTIAIDI